MAFLRGLTHKYGPLSGGEESTDDDEEVVLREISKRNALLAKAKAFGKAAAKAGGQFAVNQATDGIAGGILDFPDIRKTHKQIDGLNALKAHAAYNCSCGNCSQRIDYIIRQKTTKNRRTEVGAVPFVGSVAKVKVISHRFTKQKRGVDRKTQARELWLDAKPENVKIDTSDTFSLLSDNPGRGGCLKAMAIIAELLGGYLEHKNWDAAARLCASDEVFEKLADRMKST